MGRKPSVNFHLPQGMRMRKRLRKSGAVAVYYFYEIRENGKRREVPLGTDYTAAVHKWSQLEMDKKPKEAAVTYYTIKAKYLTAKLPELSRGTQRAYMQAFKRLDEFFGNPDAPLEDIEPAHIKEYLKWRSSPVQSGIELALFSNLWNLAVESGYLNQPNPAKAVKKHKTAKREVYIEDSLYELVYSHANQMMKDLMDLAYLLGQRPVDIVSLHTRQIIEDELHITQQKTKARLRFEIIGKTKEIIDRIKPDNGYLFINRHGRPLTPDTLRQQFRELKEAILKSHPDRHDELKNFQFRDLRAKAATDLYLSGSKSRAQEQLGHTSGRMTERYIRKTKLLKPLEK
ncbi:tyrosine-type recombinase/integrase [Neisseria leonii]|uniref:Tyrosine-type recombinase/integrase n=1 Tax=Neisseria leonii TaxID=2995413 RepID=A0A9X4E3V9_9NEIS|nr:tyrosine-type recombinase/integrase [Neisseria sp. 51.81]MDD9328245.1 tyrosine-type recombinase/integrase [Neisseria sp. 51.81]